MTEKQRKFFYFPAWGRVCEANGWRMEKGRFAGKRAATHGVADVNALYQSVWTIAEQLAITAHTGLKPDHLRHAAHVVALGQDKSSNDFTNAEVDKVVQLFRLLTDPDDLDAIIAVQHPENSERKRLVHSLKGRAPEARLIAIAKNLKAWVDHWEPPFWEDMPLDGLRVLNRIIGQEQKRWSRTARPACHPDPDANIKLSGIETPF